MTAPISKARTRGWKTRQSCKKRYALCTSPFTPTFQNRQIQYCTLSIPQLPNPQLAFRTSLTYYQKEEFQARDPCDLLCSRRETTIHSPVGPSFLLGLTRHSLLNRCTIPALANVPFHPQSTSHSLIECTVHSFKSMDNPQLIHPCQRSISSKIPRPFAPSFLIIRPSRPVGPGPFSKVLVIPYIDLFLGHIWCPFSEDERTVDFGAGLSWWSVQIEAETWR